MRLLILVFGITLGVAATAAAQDPEPAPGREYAKVTFTSPVKIGARVLMGTYVIEHDEERMAKGGPCTHIYNIDDRRLPVVAFHCVHIDRPSNDTANATVTLRRLYDQPSPMFELLEFQFAGSAAGHGVPDGR